MWILCGNCSDVSKMEKLTWKLKKRWTKNFMQSGWNGSTNVKHLGRKCWSLSDNGDKHVVLNWWILTERFSKSPKFTGIVYMKSVKVGHCRILQTFDLESWEVIIKLWQITCQKKHWYPVFCAWANLVHPTSPYNPWTLIKILALAVAKFIFNAFTENKDI